MNRGEIWLVNLEPTIGEEIKKTRRVVIVSSDEIGILKLRVVVPLTEWKDHYKGSPWMTQLIPNSNNNLVKPSVADAFQIRSISINRFIELKGSVSTNELMNIINAIDAVIESPAVYEEETE
jgi:mRNA interferase MazF